MQFIVLHKLYRERMITSSLDLDRSSFLCSVGSGKYDLAPWVFKTLFSKLFLLEIIVSSDVSKYFSLTCGPRYKINSRNIFNNKTQSCCEQLRLVHSVTATAKTKWILQSVSVIMEWVLHPIVTATATEKMGIMVTGGGVHTVCGNGNNWTFRYFPLSLLSQCERTFTSYDTGSITLTNLTFPERSSCKVIQLIWRCLKPAKKLVSINVTVIDIFVFLPGISAFVICLLMRWASYKFI